jgi:hypothetical protein
LSGDARIQVSGNQVTLLPTAVSAVTGYLPGFAEEAAREALTVRFTVPNLPYGVHLDSTKVTDEGIVLLASARNVTLETDQ